MWGLGWRLESNQDSKSTPSALPSPLRSAGGLLLLPLFSSLDTHSKINYHLSDTISKGGNYVENLLCGYPTRKRISRENESVL